MTMLTDRQKHICVEAANMLKTANCAVALTGAGISVHSGIPDFRSPGGLWSKFDPQEVCSDWALRNNPAGVWEFLADAVKMFSQAKPNPAHNALAAMECSGYLKAIITQNIDNLHQEAGSENVIEFHGGCGSFYCNTCRKDYNPDLAINLKSSDLPWLCENCQGIIRPSVVFFGEQIPEDALIKSQELAELSDLVLIAGTSGEVAPANVIPQWIKQRGGRVIEINLGSTTYDGFSDLKLDVPAEMALPQILAELERMAD